jgi:acyl carrier protein
LGTEVLALTADVTNLEQMQGVVAQTHARFGALHGVIHSVIEGKLINLIQGTTRAECERNLAPKVDALFVLEEVLQGLPLDFCLLQSSIASVLGGVGYVVYAASNTFTDAFAWYHNQTDPVPWLSVNWDTWKVGEFQAHIEQSPNLGKALRPFAMTAEEGLEAFRRVLCLDAAQVIISTGSLPARMDQWLTAKEAKEAERAPKSGKATLHPRPHLRNEYVAPRNDLEEAMAAIWQKQLGIERVGIHDNFFELGGDSLLAIQFIPLVSRTFQVDVNVQRLLETPTVAGTAAAVAEALQAQAAQSEAKAAQLLDELEHLSDDETRKLLAEEQTK